MDEQLDEEIIELLTNNNVSAVWRIWVVCLLCSWCQRVFESAGQLPLPAPTPRADWPQPCLAAHPSPPKQVPTLSWAEMEHSIYEGVCWDIDQSRGKNKLPVTKLPTLDDKNAGQGAHIGGGCFGDVFLGEAGLTRQRQTAVVLLPGLPFGSCRATSPPPNPPALLSSSSLAAMYRGRLVAVKFLTGAGARFRLQGLKRELEAACADSTRCTFATAQAVFLGSRTRPPAIVYEWMKFSSLDVKAR